MTRNEIVHKITNFLATLMALGLIFAAIWWLRGDIGHAAESTIDAYYPCGRPLGFSIGRFDEQFGIPRERVLAAADEAAAVWDAAWDRPLFFSGGRDVKINLIYDERQQTTEKLAVFDSEITNDQSGYTKLKSRYDEMRVRLESSRVAHDAMIVEFERRQAALNVEIAAANRAGGATPPQYERLTKEQAGLGQQATTINVTSRELNKQVADINALADELNRRAKDLNLQVEQYNQIASERGESFQEGEYRQENGAREINVYEFSTLHDLTRVLAHEFGHALAIDHLPETDAVMNYLNNGEVARLTEADKTALGTACGAAKNGGWRLTWLSRMAQWSDQPARLTALIDNLLEKYGQK